MEIATFETKCHCGYTFDLPELSDMSYGEFLYFDSSGNGARYLCAINNQTWQYISTIIDSELKDTSLNKGIIIRNTLGEIADKININTTYVQKGVCPKCNSFVNSNTEIKKGIMEVEEMSFKQFQKYTDSEKRRIVTEFIKL